MYVLSTNLPKSKNFSDIGIFEQGAGKLDLLKAYQLLNSYTPQVRTIAQCLLVRVTFEFSFLYFIGGIVHCDRIALT